MGKAFVVCLQRHFGKNNYPFIRVLTSQPALLLRFIRLVPEHVAIQPYGTPIYNQKLVSVAQLTRRQTDPSPS